MGLIPSPRHSPTDLEHWARLEHYDDVLAGDRRLDRRVERARVVLRRWVEAGDGVISVSWGKDSTVLAHLAATTSETVHLPLVWVRGDPWEMPECQQVRDQLQQVCPWISLDERHVTYRWPRRGEPGHNPCPPPNRPPSWTFADVVPERWASGVRAQESRVRRASAAVHGEVTARTCRPLLRWSADDVFAYLARHDLPIHPAYAMNFGGRLDRTWIRVHALGGTPVSARAEPHYARALADWEDHYYGDVLTAARRVRAHPPAAVSPTGS